MTDTGKTAKQRGLARWLFIAPLLLVYAAAFVLVYAAFEGMFLGRGHFVWKPYTIARFTPNPEYLPGISGPTVFSSNYRGLRGPDPTGAATTILVLGGSTAEGHHLDDTETWPQMMAKELNKHEVLGTVVVDNAAKAGLRMRHYYLQARDLVPELKPLDAVLMLPGPNDLIIFLTNPTASLQKPSEEVDSITFDRKVVDVSPWGREIMRKTYDRLYGLTKRQTQRLLGKLHLWKPKGEQIIRDGRGIFYVEARRRRMEGEKVDFPASLRPELDEKLALYREEMEAAVDAIKAHGVLPILLTHPINYRPSMPDALKELWWAGALGGTTQTAEGLPYVSEKSIAALLEEYNMIARRVAGEKGVPLIDLAEMFRNNTDLYYDQWHFNEIGAERIGKVVADAVLRLLRTSEN
jgi:lysophospholipase L1-like esterase